MIFCISFFFQKEFNPFDRYFPATTRLLGCEKSELAKNSSGKHNQTYRSG